MTIIPLAPERRKADSGAVTAPKPTWRQQVDACTAPSCPLFDVRPSAAP
jgi:hypothetical protein